VEAVFCIYTVILFETETTFVRSFPVPMKILSPKRSIKDSMIFMGHHQGTRDSVLT